MIELVNNAQSWTTWNLAPKRQFKLLDQMVQCHSFGHTHHRVHVSGSSGQCLVAVNPILVAIKANRRDRLPECVIAHWFQPFFHIFKCLKSLHAISIANLREPTQIYGEKT